MKVHWGKMKVVVVSRTEEECKLSIEGEDVQDVKKLKYLEGSVQMGCVRKKLNSKLGLQPKWWVQ